MLGWLTPAWKRAIGAAVVALVLLSLTDVFLYESVLIPSTSMEPAILPNERVLLAKLPYRTIRRFDVVVINSGRLNERIAKRVIGLPGERVRLEDSWKVVIDGRPLDYSATNSPDERIEAGDHPIRVDEMHGTAFETRFGRADLQLGPDEYFVLGDNRLASCDSRVIGPVPRRQIAGRLEAVWYSFDLRKAGMRWGRLFRAVR